MRAVVVHEFTDYTNLAVEELPDPAPPGPGELCFEVHAAGVSFAASLVVSGRYQRKPPRPFAPGTEAAGIVTAIGPEVTGFAPGDRIVAALDWGAWAEQARAKTVNAYRLPDAIDFGPAVAMVLSYSTSYAGLLWQQGLALEASDTLLVHGAAGGVGLAAVEIAKIVGARVIATVSSQEKLKVATEHGADHVIVTRQGQFRDAVLELTDGKGANKIYDPVGGDVFDQSLRCIATEGRIMPVGFAGGRIQNIPANLLLVKSIAVMGLNYGYYVGWSPHDARYEMAPRVRQVVEDLFDWAQAGRLRPIVSGEYVLDDFKAAMQSVLERRAIGRVVLTPQA